MTRDEFLEKFREFATQTKWILFRGHISRKCGSNLFCPITFVNHKMTGNYYYSYNFYQAGLEIGLTRKDIFDIMSAADGMPECSIELRQSIKEAANLN